MNIENRLEKLENAIRPDSESCFCRGVGPAHYDVYFQKGDGVPMKDGLPMPDQPEICQRCHKPLDKHIVIVQFVAAGEKPLAPNPDAATFNIETKRREN